MNKSQHIKTDKKPTIQNGPKMSKGQNAQNIPVKSNQAKQGMNSNDNKVSQGMSKKDKKNKGRLFKNKEAYDRMKFLYQAARLNLTLNPDNEELSRYYMKCFRKVKEKKCLKWTRENKQSICNGCQMIQLPGLTTRIRIGDHKRIIMTCISCKSRKRAHIRTTSKKKKKKRRIENKTKSEE